MRHFIFWVDEEKVILDEDDVKGWVKRILPPFSSEKLVGAVVDSLMDGGLAKIPEKQMEYVYRYFVEDLPIPKIASYCDVNKSTVSRLLQRANDKVLQLAKECEWQLHRKQYLSSGSDLVGFAKQESLEARLRDATKRSIEASRGDAGAKGTYGKEIGS